MSLHDSSDRCPCSKDDLEDHLFPGDHRELQEVGVYCLKCDDWCTRYGVAE